MGQRLSDAWRRAFDPLDATGEAIWIRARPIAGRNPHYVRLDDHGNEIHRLAYGDSLSPFGWRAASQNETVPGGSGAIAYLQPSDGHTHLSLLSSLVGLLRGGRTST